MTFAIAQDIVRKGRFVLQSQELAKWFTAYAPVMRRGEGLFFASPSILERKFRDEVEIFSAKLEDEDYSRWYLTSTSVAALLDACLQVRDAVGRVCGTLEEASGHLHEYDPGFSPLYRIFRENGILYPMEPLGLFEKDSWSKGFESLEDLVHTVTAAQIWANWMMAALHLLAELLGQHSLYKLPPMSCAQVAAAHRAYLAWEASRLPEQFMLPNWGAPVACGDPVRYQPILKLASWMSRVLDSQVDEEPLPASPAPSLRSSRSLDDSVESDEDEGTSFLSRCNSF
ncbi:hypothetical protein FRC10_007768 [Ceratobasidium sp. 414]|nr:hypothetical protein FRC10_007768 [Ceratobasidium sp. 414]